MTAATPNAGGGGEKPVKEQRILLWVEAPADKLKAPDSGLNIALEKLGRMQTRLRDIDRLWSKIASKTLPNLPTPTPSVRASGGVSGAAATPSSGGLATSGVGKVLRTVFESDAAGVEGAAKEVVSALNAAQTSILKARTRMVKDKEGNEVEKTTYTREDKAQLQRLKDIREELSKQAIERDRNLETAAKMGTKEQQLRAAAVAHSKYSRGVAGIAQLQGVEDPEVQARLQKLSTRAQLDATKAQQRANAEAAAVAQRAAAEKQRADEKEALRRQKAQDASDKWQAKQEQNATKAIAAARAASKAQAIKDAEDAAMRAQIAAYAAAPKGTSGQNRVATLQGRVAGLKSLQGFHATSPHGNPSQLLQITNSLAVAQNTLASASAALNQQYSHIGKNMVQNVAHVTAWAAAVGTLYGSLRMLRHGADAVMELEYAQARLGQVFRHGPEQVSGLTNEILKLAAANGRSSKEAMDSAIQWSRLNLNRAQVTEAVRVSLMGANVAELTAAESTEHLASLYQVYGLKVSELNSVLGMLNNTSNTFNVTNKDLLDGITRTSSAAKQAGISLAELIGLIGAGVGTTGQTGSNIGNSLKSFIGALASPDKQKLMRDQFKFEVTVGGSGEVKDMSQLLSELFVSFQRMSAAERQSMVFNVAGKNQASRITAMLDNYIRAQVLAINAQLNLNSAEQENKAIREVSKAQLQGLVTEFERFSLSVATFGPGKFSGLEAFNEVLQAMRNSLAALGGGPGAAIVGLMAAIAGKSLVMMTQMGAAGKGAGVLRNSMGGAVQALREVSQALIQGIGLYGRVPGPVGKIATAWGGVARSTHGAKMAFTALGAGITLAAAELAAVAGLIWMVSVGVNAAANAFGLSSDKADKAMQDMAMRAEVAKGAAEAAQTQIKLYDTMQKALAAAPSKSGRSGLIEQMMEGVPESRRNGLRKELSEANNHTDEMARNAAFRKAFEKETADATGRAAMERARHYRIERDNIRALENEISRLQNTMAGKAGWNDGDIKKKRDQLAEMRNRRVARSLEDTEEQEASAQSFRSTSQSHLIFLEKQRSLLQSIKDLYSDLPGDSHLDQHRKTVMALEQQKVILEAQSQILGEQRKSAGVVQAESESAKASSAQRRAQTFKESSESNLMAMVNARALEQGSAFSERSISEIFGRDIFAEGAEPVTSTNTPISLRVEEINAANEAQKKHNQLQRESATLESNARKLRSRPGFREADEAYKANLKAKEEVERALQAQSEAVARQRDRMATFKNVATFRSDSFALSGTTQDEGINRQIGGNSAAYAGHIAAIKRLEAELKTAKTLEDQRKIQQQISDEAISALQHEGSLKKQAETLLQRKFQIEQESIKAQKEFSKQMLFDSPGNILKRMAMLKLTDGGKNMRGFMGFDEGGRNMLRPMVENGMAAGQNAADRLALGNKVIGRGINGAGDLVDFNAKFEKWGIALAEKAGNAFKPIINESAAAATNLIAMNTQVKIAAGEMASFTEGVISAVQALRALTNPNGPPANPQSPSTN